MSTVFPWWRLFREDDGVEGCLWFAKTNDNPFHIVANLLRICFKLLFSPLNMIRVIILLFTPKSVQRAILKIKREYFSPLWRYEFADTPDALLVTGGNRYPEYAPTGRDPRFIIELDVYRPIGVPGYDKRPIRFEKGMQYTALSYPMTAAEELYGAQLPTEPTLEERRKVSEAFLAAYATASPFGRQYVWLDEWCLAEVGDNRRGRGSIRSEELGAIADIFRHASRVCVFCNVDGCDHTGQECPWGQRLWTLPEIVHASEISTMVRNGDTLQIVDSPSARSFQERMQSKAALKGDWHLYAILQHASNSGTVSWQHAIHALVVEAIRRGEAGGYENHILIGRALNGLLPRRAQLGDLEGVDGWSDLEWLLELNQGFYNAASLAALCTLDNGHGLAAGRPSPGWLGKPIAPRVGNERLEPLLNAFPVGYSDPNSTVLQLIGPEILGVRHTLKRDGDVLYHSLRFLPVRWIGLLIVILVCIHFFSLKAIWLSSAFYTLMELLLGTMYIVRHGWVFLPDETWGLQQGNGLQEALCRQDSTFTKKPLREWGNKQLCPTWGAPKQGKSFSGTLIDLNAKCYTKCVTSGIPNCVVPLAQHGNGITCMLVDHATSRHSPAPKLGLANVPPHILASTHKSGSMMVGEKKEPTEDDDLWPRFLRWIGDKPSPSQQDLTRQKGPRPDVDLEAGVARAPEASEDELKINGAEVGEVSMGSDTQTSSMKAP